MLILGKIVIVTVVIYIKEPVVNLHATIGIETPRCATKNNNNNNNVTVRLRIQWLVLQSHKELWSCVSSSNA